MIEATIELNDLIDLRVYPIDNIGKVSIMPIQHVQFIKSIIKDKEIFPSYTDIINVQYLNNKRGFVLTLNDRKRFFLRPLLKRDINLIYLGRRLMGQPHCCARAHATNLNMPGIYSAPEKFRSFEVVNLIPCRDCFEKSEHEYMVYVKQHQHNVVSHQSTEKINMIFAASLVYLMGDPDPDLYDHEEMPEINKAFYIRSIESTVRGLQGVAAEGLEILKRSEMTTDGITAINLQMVENIVNTCNAHAHQIINTPIEQIDTNQCYELGETMSQVRGCLNNLIFAIKYRGNNGII